MNPSSDTGGIMPGHRVRALLMAPVSKEREMLARFLSAWNFEPVPAASADQARTVGPAQDVSIAVIADQDGGPETMALVRALREATPGIETILITENEEFVLFAKSFHVQRFSMG